MVAPPLVKDTQDAAVQSECLSASEEKAIQVPASTAGEVMTFDFMAPGIKRFLFPPILFILRRSVVVSS